MALSAQRIVEFYQGSGRDAAGRTFEGVLALSDAALEAHHDYVQWLFPLTEPSRAVPGSPVLSAAELEQFRARPELRARVLTALQRMLAFYGFTLAGSLASPVVERSPAYSERSGQWLERPHNFLRLTRILKCLQALGLAAHAQALFAALRAVYAEHPQHIGAESFAFWRDAARS